MAEMIRKQVYIEPRQDRRLKMLAKDLGVTEAELIRQGIDRGLPPMPTSRPNPVAWKEALRFIKARRRKRIPKRKHRWIREELYDR